MTPTEMRARAARLRKYTWRDFLYLSWVAVNFAFWLWRGKWYSLAAAIIMAVVFVFERWAARYSARLYEEAADDLEDLRRLRWPNPNQLN